LKPVVFTFARLFAITSIIFCWAAMPLAEVLRLGFIDPPRSPGRSRDP
jgi:hypothetical protein